MPKALARKGLPPPERVFEKVNGDDRGRRNTAQE